MYHFVPAFVGRGQVVHAMHTSPESHRLGKTACGRVATTDTRSCDANAEITCRACQDALPSWIGVGPAAETPQTSERCTGCAESQFGTTHTLRCPEYALRAAWGLQMLVETDHAEALAIHLQREASQHRVLIVTGGELHNWAAAPKADMTINLSRMLRDPAHVPTGEMLDQRGDESEAVREFVMSTPGAWELIEDMCATVVNTASRVPLVVHVLCRGGKHRAAAFGKTLREELDIFAVDAVVHHLHAHLPRVITGEKA